MRGGDLVHVYLIFAKFLGQEVDKGLKPNGYNYRD